MTQGRGVPGDHGAAGPSSGYLNRGLGDTIINGLRGS